jgi:peptide/nickel transport system permease protein
MTRLRSAPAFGGALLAGVALAWISAWILPYDVTADVRPQLASQGPSAAAWLGTDHMGRDVGRRLLLGSHAFLLPGAFAAALAGLLGTVAGAAGAWLGGPVAALVRYVSTVLASIPRFVFVLLAGAVFGPDVGVLAVATAIASTPAVCDAVSARIDHLKRSEFVIALRAHGVPDSRILLHHLLWVNGRGLLARQILSTFGFFLVVETTLSYLGGFGVQEPVPSWGNMLAFEFGVPDGNPLAWLAPAAAIWAAILGTALVGQELGLQEGAQRG